MPVKQGHAEIFFKRADLPANRGLTEAERFACVREAARFGNGMKNPQFVPIHHGLCCLKRPC